MQELTRFPIDIFDLTQRYQIQTFAYNEVEAELKLLKVNPTADTALAFRANKKDFIFYSDTMSPERLRFAIAHELGHILLQHLDRGEVISIFDEYTESEANIFASRLLMPAIVCHDRQLRSAEQIAAFFGVSKEAAEIRADRMKLLERRGKWLSSPLEKEYYEILKRTK